MSNNMNPDQAWGFDRPDLSPNCLQRLSVDDNGRQRVNIPFEYKLKAQEQLKMHI